LHHASLGMRQDPIFHHAGPQPLPHEPPHSAILDPVAQYCSPLGPVHAVEVSTHICVHHPAQALTHAPLAQLVPRMVGAATPPKAIGAVVKVLLRDRLQPHRDRSLDHLVLDCGLADRASAPVPRFDPDTLDGRRLIASLAQTLGQVTQVLVEVFGLRLRRHSVDSWGT
jgi:hypothetical protein